MVNYEYKDLIRFWNKVDIRGVDECWPWLAGSSNEGYGRFRLNGRLYGSNILAHLFETGEYDPIFKMVCHTCDNPPCCNPKHLFLGTRSDNMRDASHKGRLDNRNLKLSKIHRKLTDFQATEIIVSSLSTRELGRLYNISQAVVSSIKLGKSYKDLYIKAV